MFSLAGVCLIIALLGKAAKDEYAFLAMCCLLALDSAPWLHRRLRQRQLAEKNAQGETRLMRTARDGKIGPVKDCLAGGAEVNEKDRSGQTALMKASANGHIAIVRLLLTQGAEVNDKDGKGLTALDRAAANGHPDIVELLKQSGAKDSRMPRNTAPQAGV